MCEENSFVLYFTTEISLYIFKFDLLEICLTTFWYTIKLTYRNYIYLHIKLCIVLCTMTCHVFSKFIIFALAFMVVVDARTMMLVAHVTAPDIALFGQHSRYYFLPFTCTRRHSVLLKAYVKVPFLWWHRLIVTVVFDDLLSTSSQCCYIFSGPSGSMTPIHLVLRIEYRLSRS